MAAPAPRLLIHAEGQAEKLFVDKLLAPHLCECGYASVSARVLGDDTLDRKGGIRRWEQVQRYIVHHLKRDSGAHATTFVDYNGLPKGDSWAGPNEKATPSSSSARRVEGIEELMARSIAESLGERDATTRFVPFVTLHEFEALLFSDCHVLARAVEKQIALIPRLTARLQTVVKNAGGSPEDINGEISTSPARRLQNLIPQYAKVTSGARVIDNISLDTIRNECSHFSSWVEKLERMARS